MTRLYYSGDPSATFVSPVETEDNSSVTMGSPGGCSIVRRGSCNTGLANYGTRDDAVVDGRGLLPAGAARKDSTHPATTSGDLSHLWIFQRVADAQSATVKFKPGSRDVRDCSLSSSGNQQLRRPRVTASGSSNSSQEKIDLINARNSQQLCGIRHCVG